MAGGVPALDRQADGRPGARFFAPRRRESRTVTKVLAWRVVVDRRAPTRSVSASSGD